MKNILIEKKHMDFVAFFHQYNNKRPDIVKKAAWEIMFQTVTAVIPKSPTQDSYKIKIFIFFVQSVYDTP